MSVENPFGVIYKITNQKNDKIYIGQTSGDLNIRLHGHKAGGNADLCHDINKIGHKFFSIEVLRKCGDQEEMNAWEMFYVQQAHKDNPKTLYNKNPYPYYERSLSERKKINTKSRIRMCRVPLELDDYIREKAENNPANPHNHVATEINALIKADFERAQRKAKRK